ncbi:hypothetical protein ACO1O0_004673 [Amphichorda felina]
MKVAASALLFAAALGGVSAHPSGNAHQHQHMHRSVEERGVKFVKVVKPVAEPTTTAQPTTTQAPAAPAQPTTTTKAAETKPKPTTPASSGGDGQGVSTYTEFCGGEKTKRATIAEIHYKGNVGSASNYGCNMMLAKSNVADEYKYNVKIKNALAKEQECVGYLKIGPDGGVNGFFDGNEAVRFNLPANGVQYLVVDENTQGGVVCGVGSIPLTNFGEFASTWAEFDFGNESNDGWSGADASCLVSAAEGLDIPGLNLCGHGTCSTIYPGGKGKNAFLAGMEALDGLGLNIPAGKARLEVTVGYQG